MKEGAIIASDYPLLEGFRKINSNDFHLMEDADDWGEDRWSYCLTPNRNIEEIFGADVRTETNVDYVGIYATVNVGYDEVDDHLEITLCKDGCIKKLYNYKLSYSEKVALLELVVAHETKRLRCLVEHLKANVSKKGQE